METVVIKPTIGRRIWYWPTEAEKRDSLDPAQAFDAGVVWVRNDTHVNLDVGAHNGHRFFRPNIEISAQAVPGCAQWMHYQVGQASKASEAMLAATPAVTEEMVSRFLAWPMPKDFAPDCGVSFDGRKDDELNKNKGWPVGTNLLTASQARAMLEHVVRASPPAAIDANVAPGCSLFSDPSKRAPAGFGWAIQMLKAGNRVCRAGWNGKGMWLALSPGVVDLPAASFWAGPNHDYAASQGGTATVLPCITMKTAGGEILPGWLASQTDMLAEDWQLVA